MRKNYVTDVTDVTDVDVINNIRDISNIRQKNSTDPLYLGRLLHGAGGIRRPQAKRGSRPLSGKAEVVSEVDRQRLEAMFEIWSVITTSLSIYDGGVW